MELTNRCDKIEIYKSGSESHPKGTVINLNASLIAAISWLAYIELQK